MGELGSWVLLPENRSAHAAIEAVLECVSAGRRRRAHNPLFIHGPPGCGKSHLTSALVGEVTRRVPDSVAAVLSAQSFLEVNGQEESDDELPVASARRADLVVIEDLQHLPQRFAETVAAFVDSCLVHGRQVVATATAGPARLTHLPARLTSRLAGGLVVGILPLTPAGRSAFLEDRFRRRRWAVSPEIVDWLARHCEGSARQLEGAIARIEALRRVQRDSLSLEDVVALFEDEAAARGKTVERIAQRVGTYFQVAPRTLKSRRRTRDALLPRQVGMYLARQLTGMSLAQIGAYFGGRDHSTVLHACRKVEEALTQDAGLCGVVRQLMAEVA